MTMTHLDNLAELVLDSVSHPKLHALSGLHTSNLKLDKELGAFEFAQDAGSGRLCHASLKSNTEDGMDT
jgi:hypothetical protein